MLNGRLLKDGDLEAAIKFSIAICKFVERFEKYQPQMTAMPAICQSFEMPIQMCIKKQNFHIALEAHLTKLLLNHACRRDISAIVQQFVELKRKAIAGGGHDDLHLVTLLDFKGN